MPTPFEISSRIVDDLVELLPLFATMIGVRGREGEWNDLSPEGQEALVEHARSNVSDLAGHLDHPDPDHARSEVIRYLGWPGQAISSKIGEPEILRLREDECRRLGSDFDLKQFHSRVLGRGEMGLDLLGRVVAGEFES